MMATARTAAAAAQTFLFASFVLLHRRMALPWGIVAAI